MDAVYLAVGGFVIIIALYKRELLCEPSSFKIILGIAITISLAGAVLALTKPRESIISGVPLSPPFSVGLFWGHAQTLPAVVSTRAAGHIPELAKRNDR